MNKKLIALVLTASIISGQAVVAFADPVTEQQVEESRNQLQNIEEVIGGLEDKVRALDEEIISMDEVIAKNIEEINKLNIEIENAKVEIENLMAQIDSKEELLGSRIRGMYKKSNQNEYIAILLDSEGFSDFIQRVEAISKIVGTDQKIIEELKSSKEALEKIQEELALKGQELQRLNEENDAKMQELQVKKEEQNIMVAQAVAERAKIEVNLEEEEGNLVAFPISIINAGTGTDSEIKNTISTLVNLRNSIVTPGVDSKVEAAINQGQKILKDRRDAENARILANQARESGGNTSGNNSKPIAPAPPSRGESGSGGSGTNIINYSYNFLGIPYVWGGTTPSGFDCSGFTSYVYRNFGYNIGRTTRDQINVGRAVSRSELKPGDLVFTSQGHLGIYVGDDKMIHSPQTGDKVKVSKIWSFYAARRVIN